MGIINGLFVHRIARGLALAMMALLAFAACTGGGGDYTTPTTDNNGMEIRVANVNDGQTFAKTDDVLRNSELVDITLDIQGTNVPDGTDLIVRVQGTVTIDGDTEPGVAFEHIVMNRNSGTTNVLLFPGLNTISFFFIPEDDQEASARYLSGDLEPILSLDVSSSYQSVGDDLEDLISEDQYNQITADSRNNPICYEQHNRTELGLPDQINGQWYFTYENFIKAMRKIPRFAGEGDLNTRKLELAAFFANVAQETGSGGPYGAGCAIQEGWGAFWKNPNFGGLAPTGAGYAGRGPHQLTHDYNYKAFGQDMGQGDAYLNDPDILTKNPAVGIAGSLWFWNHAEPQTGSGSLDPPFKPACHDVMIHEWTPTSNDIAGGRTVDRDFGVVINIINGGLECNKTSVEAQNRVNYYRAIAQILGAVIPDSKTDADFNCANQHNFAECPSSTAWPCN